jgi:hypothetical protein
MQTYPPTRSSRAQSCHLNTPCARMSRVQEMCDFTSPRRGCFARAAGLAR